MERLESEKMKTTEKAETEIKATKEDKRLEKSSKSDDRVSLPRHCRLCAIPNNDMVDIFASSDTTEGDVLQMIRHCLRITVKETDTLPKKACRVCLEKLQLCYQFNQIVAEAESQLLALDRQARVKPNGTEKHCQPSAGNVQCGTTVHPEIESTPLCGEMQNAKQFISVKKGLTIAETVKTRPDLTRSSVVPVATETQPRSLWSNDCKKDGRRSSSDDGHNDANPSMDDSNSQIQSTSESGISRMRRSGSRSNEKNLLKTPREEQSEDVKIKAETSLINNTSDPHRRVDDLPIANPVIEAPVDIRNRRYKCSDCTKTYLRKSGLIEHSRLHTGQRLHTCQYCEKKFLWRSLRDVHQRQVHSEERPFKCSLCEKSFKSSKSMMDHTFIHRKHEDSAAYRCSVCNKAFKFKSQLNTHIAMHSGEKQWQCDYCKKRFTIKSNLKSHLNSCKERTDIGKQCHKCNSCPKSFKSKHCLRRHYRLHTGKNLHSCEYCKKNFTSKWNRDSHLLVHTKKRPYKCANSKSSTSGVSRVIRNGSRTNKKNLSKTPGEKESEDIANPVIDAVHLEIN